MRNQLIAPQMGGGWRWTHISMRDGLLTWEAEAGWFIKTHAWGSRRFYGPNAIDDANRYLAGIARNAM